MSSTSNDPGAWLGLLKWSLAYTDGTSDEAPTPMLPEDKAFLETVMKEGIINEGERMKEILKLVGTQMEEWTAATGKKEQYVTTEQEDIVNALLEELRDIVEQIDYARAFCAIAGLQFLLGSVQADLPESTRLACLGITSTVCQNNPPVQKQLLELGSLRILSDLFFATPEVHVRARIVQAISANVRSHDLAEAVYCELEQAVELLEQAVGRDTNDVPVALLKRGIFFLRALITSDGATRARVRKFNASICWVADRLWLNNTTPADNKLEPEVCEMILGLLCQILQQKKSVNAVLSRKEALVGAAVVQVAALRALTGEEKEYCAVELELWENLIGLLARTEPDPEEEPPLMLEDGSAQDPNTLMAQ